MNMFDYKTRCNSEKKCYYLYMIVVFFYFFFFKQTLQLVGISMYQTQRRRTKAGQAALHYYALI